MFCYLWEYSLSIWFDDCDDELYKYFVFENFFVNLVFFRDKDDYDNIFLYFCGGEVVI